MLYTNNTKYHEPKNLFNFTNFKIDHVQLFIKKTTAPVVLFILIYLIFSQSAFSQNALVPFNFILNTSAKTSAGIYKKDGTLVRTLWNNVTYPAGTNKGTWDRKDDEGRLVSDTGFVVKLVSSNTSYKWEGVIGNTSDSLTGSTVIRMFFRMHCLTIAGKKAFYGAGYTEGITSSYRFNTDDPQKKYNILYSDVHDMAQASIYVATDSNYVYWAGFDGFDNKKAFVYGTKVSNDQEVMFSSGTSVDITYGKTYPKAIDITNSLAASPTGLAVQKAGNFLFVSHKGTNELHVLNKSTGALVQTISISAPMDLAFDRNDNLWMISGTNVVQKYSVNSNGTLSSAILTLSGLVEPLALAVSPDNKNIVVIDGGSSQQLKAYNNSTGASVWTFGQAGGYTNDPAVTDDKFYFSDNVTKVSKPYIAFQSDGSFWVGDVGNERTQHYTASKVFINRIMCLPHSYSVSADKNDPTRVFNEYLEFKVDYSKPLASNNGSWTLVKNWRRGITAKYFQPDMFRIFPQVMTLSNGRTYAILEYCANADDRYPEIVEFPSSGNLRYTGVRLDMHASDQIQGDGSLLKYLSTGRIGEVASWETQALTGFINNNPVWGNSTNIGNTPTIALNDPASGYVVDPVMTSSNMLVVFDKDRANTGYHLGGVKKGDNKYLWKTSSSTTRDYAGPFPKDGAFDIGNTVEYSGGHAYTIEKSILWNYHGEFWKNSQTNMWNHYYDNGLMIGQFGVALLDVERIVPEAYPMGAGNVFSSVVVKAGGDYYIYHNDESVHAGIHRWKVSGLNTIKEQTISISYALNTTGGLTGSFFNSPDLNNVNFVTAAVTSVNFTTPPTQVTSSNNFSVRWTGFVKPAYSQNYTFYTKTTKGVRLWIDGQLVINKWTNSALTEYPSLAVKLESGKIYSVKMEINGGAADLLWSSSGQVKQIIPSGSLYPSEFTDYTIGIDLMEGLHYKSFLANGMYGWNRNAVNEDSTGYEQYWHARTSIKSYLKDRPDLYMSFRGSNTQNYVSRELALPASQCMGQWKLSGSLDYDGDFARWDDENDGGYFDILDINGKIIARIVRDQHIINNEMYNTLKCNGKKVYDMHEKYAYAINNKPQDFELVVTSSGVTFKYGDYNAVTSGLFDNSCNWSLPKTIKFNFIGSPTTYDRVIILHKLFISSDGSAAPAVSKSGPTSFCQGGSVTLTAGNSTSYLWSNSATTKSITVSTSGTYYVTIKDMNGCSQKSPSVIVMANALPTPVINGPSSYCKGSSVALTASQASSYLWNNNATTQTISVSSTGNYSVTVVDGNGCSGSSSPFVITENPLPTSSATAGGPLNFCQGKSVTLTAPPAISYLWNNTATTQSIAVFISGNYSVKVTDANGCISASSAPINVTVDPIPIPTVTANGVTMFCDGSNVILSSSLAKSYLWNTSETTQSITVLSSGNYVVNATDDNGCSAPSQAVPVTVNPIPAPVISISNDTLLTSSSNSGNQWYFNGQMMSGSTSKNLIANLDGNYHVMVTENNCAGTSPSVTVKRTVGISGVISGNFTLFPNPSDGIIHLNGEQLTGSTILIKNTIGVEIYRKIFNGYEIDLSNEAKGTYIITVISEEGKYTQKLVLH